MIATTFAMSCRSKRAAIPALLGWALATAAAPAEPPRIVEVEFQVKAPEFATNLRKTLPLLQENIADELARMGCDHLGFVRWEPSSPDGDRQPDAKLIIALAENGGNVFLTFESYRHHRRQLLFDTAYDPLYYYYEKPPTGNRTRLECDLAGSRNAQREKKPCKRYLPRLFESEDFRDRLLRSFLGKIAIATDLRHQSRRLLVPIDHAALAAHDGCRLKAEFETRIDDRQAGLCRLDLVKSGSYEGQVRTKVERTDFDYLDPVVGWHDAIPEALDHKLDESVKVFVASGYKKDPFPGTFDGLVTDLEGSIGVCSPSPAPN